MTDGGGDGQTSVGRDRSRLATSNSLGDKVTHQLARLATSNSIIPGVDDPIAPTTDGLLAELDEHRTRFSGDQESSGAVSARCLAAGAGESLEVGASLDDDAVGR